MSYGVKTISLFTVYLSTKSSSGLFKLFRQWLVSRSEKVDFTLGLVKDLIKIRKIIYFGDLPDLPMQVTEYKHCLFFVFFV